MSAIVNPRDILMQATPTRLLPVTLPPNVVIPALVPDLLVPPSPTGLAVAAAIANLVITHDNPAFATGHGYLRTHVYGAVWSGGALPVFANAVKINSFSGAVGPHPTNPATAWRIWATWVSKDGVESLPAGGPNGLAATTGQDVEKLVAALTGPGNPLVTLTVPTLIGGVTYPAGTYSAAAFIFDGQIVNAKIGNLAVDDAKIVSLAVAKLLAGQLAVGQYIESSNYSAANGTGFRLHADGTLSLPNGSIDAAKLTIGVGTNLLDNAGFAHGSANWTLEEAPGVSASLIPNLAGYVPVGGNSLAVHQPNNFYNGQSDKYQGVYSKPMPVLPGKRYEFSVYTGAHRCNANALLVFENASGTILSQGVSNTNAQEASGGVGLDSFKRLSGFAVAPASTVAARLYVRKTPTVPGQGNSYMFLAQALVAEAGIGQTTPSSWSLGGTGVKITPEGVNTPSLQALSAIMGDLYAGSVRGGSFTGWGWPATGGGFYLGPNGLLLGNNNTGQWAQFNADGSMSMPGLSCAGGVLTINQLNVVKTANIAGNAVTTSVAASGATAAWGTLWIPAGETMRISIDGRCEGGVGVTLYIDGMAVAAVAATEVRVYADTGDAGSWSSYPLPAQTMGILDVSGGGGRNITVGASVPESTYASKVVFKALGTLR